MGDVHGAFDDFVAILRRSGVIDEQHHWSAKNLTLVQLGDLIDRGPKPREVMDLLMALQEEAPRAGGRVVPLLGNHEVMNIMGDLRYVTAANYASFADQGSEQRRHAAYQKYAKWRADHAALLSGVPQLQEQSEAEWDAKHPAGFLEQREAFGPEGKYGKWLRGNAAVAEVGGVVFLHGGISPVLASMKREEINRRVHEELATFDKTKRAMVNQGLILPFFTLEEMTVVVQAELASRSSPRSPPPGPGAPPALPEPVPLPVLQDFLGYGEWLSVASTGPLWFRGYAQWKEEGNAEHAANLLKKIGATHIVVGHTPQTDGRIHSRFGGKIFLIDTGMLSSYFAGGQASALEISGGTKFTAEYMDQKIVLFDEGAGASQSNVAVQPNR